MFRDLIGRYCSRGTITVPFADLKALPTCVHPRCWPSSSHACDRLKVPTGFVFHESRCGSTLVANILASDIANMVDPRAFQAGLLTDWQVFSESTPPAQVMNDCYQCTDERKIELLRVVINAMGNSRIHARLYFKFQSMLSAQMEVIQRVC